MKISAGLRKGLTAVLTVSLCAISLTGCGKAYDYDLSEYLTLGQYKGVELTTDEIDSSMQSSIDSLISQHTETNDITDRAAQSGDTVNIDYTGYIDGEIFEGGSATGSDITLGSGGYIDGFEDGIIGMQIDETKTVDCTFPDEYTNNPDLAGKSAQFEITLNTITENVAPEYNDEFIASLESEDYTTVAEYETLLRESTVRSLVWNKVVSACTVKAYPKDELKTYYDNMVSYYEKYANQYGVTLSTYITSYAGTDVDTFLTEVTTVAQQYVLSDMVVYAVSRAEDITVTDEQYDEYAAKYAASYSYDTVKAYEKAYGKSEVMRNVLTEVVQDYLVAQSVQAAASEAQ